MDDSDHSSKLEDTKAGGSKELKLETQASKRRKVVEKTVLAVKIEASDGKQKSEGPPSDCWSWRKYGQKPIKGSPYPRGYYKCSTSKGCSAKKQVERCKTDSSMLIITYTSTHNHPGPHDLTQPVLKEPQNQPSHENLPTTNPKKEKEKEEPTIMSTSTTDIIINYKDPKSSDQDDDDDDDDDDHYFHYSQSPFTETTTTLDQCCTPTILFDDQYHHQVVHEPISYPHHLITFSSSTPKSAEENDFYDELEELPCISSSSSSSSSYFTSFMRTNFFDEGILVHPS